MMPKSFYTIAIMTLLIGFGLLVTVLWWVLYPYKVLEFTSPPTILTKEVYAGDTLYYQFTYCKYMDIPSQVEKEFIDGVIYAVPAIKTNNPTGCRTSIAGTNVPNLPTGTYKQKMTFRYQVNPLREVKVELETDEFFIKKATVSSVLQ